MCYFVDEYDACPVWNVTHPRARKPHTCIVCRLTIPVGNVYDRIGALHTGHWTTHTLHAECHELAQDIQIDACNQSVYLVEGLDIAHDVLEHEVEHPEFRERWTEIQNAYGNSA
jgi:hypothetical protein